MPDALKEIIEKKRERLAAVKQQVSLELLKEQAASSPAPRSLSRAINRKGQISLIAEIKKASPSLGEIRQEFDPVGIARCYQDVGAQAISVLTEEDHFQGSLDILRKLRPLIELPLLRKDFILEPYQLYESRAAGADAVLLISECLKRDEIAGMLDLASELGLECLVEAHSEKELKKVLRLGAPIIGINNRDLHTLEVTTSTVEKLFPLIPRDRTVIVESGLHKYQDILFLKILGVNAVLIGSAFMRAQDIARKVEEVMGW